MGIAGTWKAVSRQATYGVTPVRKVKSGDIADMVLRGDGTGYMLKKKLFGQEQQQLLWSADWDGYTFVVPESGLTITGLIENGKLVTIWHCGVGAIDGMGVTYVRA